MVLWRRSYLYRLLNDSTEKFLIVFREGTATNPAIRLVLSAVQIFLSLKALAAGEIVVWSIFEKWTSNRKPLTFLDVYRRLMYKFVSVHFKMAWRANVGKFKRVLFCKSTVVLFRRCDGSYSCGSFDLQLILTKTWVNFSRVYLFERRVAQGIFVEYT